MLEAVSRERHVASDCVQQLTLSTGRRGRMHGGVRHGALVRPGGMEVLCCISESTSDRGDGERQEEGEVYSRVPLL